MDSELRAIKENEVERYDGLLIAAEAWANGYKKDRRTYKEIIKAEAKLRRQIRGVFRDSANNLDRYINWNAYNGQLTASVDVSVIVAEELYDDIDDLFFTVTFETLSTAVALGAQAGESIYKIPLGIQSSDAIIQQLTTERLAYLVGKKVDKNGDVVENPKAEYRVSDKVRADIAKNIQTGIALNEDKATMTKRLETIVKNPKRAEVIAQTETVNAYGEGMLEFGRESNATGKEWEDVGAIDICADNTAMGIIPLEDVFVSGDTAPAAHVGCRCNMRIVYSNEYNG